MPTHSSHCVCTLYAPCNGSGALDAEHLRNARNIECRIQIEHQLVAHPELAKFGTTVLNLRRLSSGVGLITGEGAKVRFSLRL